MHRIRHSDDALTPTYARRHACEPVPKFRIPEPGMPAESAYRLIVDELRFDANPSLNLASFVSSWMEPEADKLMQLTASKNMIDEEEYPQTAEIGRRVVSMIAHMLNAPKHEAAIGCVTVGSSEAIMLGLLAHKRSWQKRCAAAGRPATSPNIVFGADAHTCLEKFARYFEVEARIVPMGANRYTLAAADVANVIDENTVAVCGIVGTTFTGQMDDIVGINKVLAHVEKEKGWHIPLHIDAASGGFVLPFTRPELLWDFRLSQVHSINLSNHKYGLVYPGMGSLIFRDQTDIPDELVFHINYLGGDMPNYSLNFSRPSSQVVAQYYNLIRLGQQGYRTVMQNITRNARYLAECIGKCSQFELIGDGSLFPVVVFKARDPKACDIFALARRLRQRGWVIPAYTLPPHAEATAVMRAVVRESLSRDMIEVLVNDLHTALADLHGPEQSAKNRSANPPNPSGNVSQPVC